MLPPETIRSVLAAYVDALTRRDRDAFLALFADDAVQHDPVGEPPRAGRSAIAGWWDRALTEWDRFTITAREIYVVDSSAALVWTIEEQSRGTKREFSGVDVVLLNAEAKIASVHAYWERANLPDFR